MVLKARLVDGVENAVVRQLLGLTKQAFCSPGFDGMFSTPFKWVCFLRNVF